MFKDARHEIHLEYAISSRPDLFRIQLECVAPITLNTLTCTSRIPWALPEYSWIIDPAFNWTEILHALKHTVEPYLMVIPLIRSPPSFYATFLYQPNTTNGHILKPNRCNCNFALFIRPLQPVIHSSPDRVVLVEGRRHLTLIASLLPGV